MDVSSLNTRNHNPSALKNKIYQYQEFILYGRSISGPNPVTSSLNMHILQPPTKSLLNPITSSIHKSSN